MNQIFTGIKVTTLSAMLSLKELAIQMILFSKHFVLSSFENETH
jgi:hypothetical protein